MTPLLLAVPLALAAPLPKDFQKAGVLDGTWELTRLEYGGDVIATRSTWRFDGQTLVIRNAGHNPSAPCPVRIDPTAKTFDIVGGNQLGRYAVAGDTLSICLGGLPDKRPENFDAAHAVFHYTFARARDKTPEARR